MAKEVVYMNDKEVEVELAQDLSITSPKANETVGVVGNHPTSPTHWLLRDYPLIGIDQYGNAKRLKTLYPRREIADMFCRSGCQLMYRDNADGTARKVGYVVAGHWVELFHLVPWEGPRVLGARGAVVQGIAPPITQLCDSDLVERKHLIQAWESRDAMAAECERLRAELSTLKRDASQQINESC